MVKMRTLGLASFLVVGLFACAQAAPIVYNGQLFDGVPVVGVTTQPNANPSNPVGAQYYFFFANAGDPITIFGDRLDGGFDMSFWVLSGLYADTNDFGGSFPGGAAFSDFGDDEDFPNIPGPFGDPRSIFNAPFTGFYTVAVTNFLSSGSPPFDFRLQANGVSLVPEPASIAGWGLIGGLGLLFARRRKLGAKKV